MTQLGVDSTGPAADLIVTEIGMAIQHGTTGTRCRPTMSTPSLQMHTASANHSAGTTLGVCEVNIGRRRNLHLLNETELLNER